VVSNPIIDEDETLDLSLGGGSPEDHGISAPLEPAQSHMSAMFAPGTSFNVSGSAPQLRSTPVYSSLLRSLSSLVPAYLLRPVHFASGLTPVQPYLGFISLSFPIASGSPPGRVPVPVPVPLVTTSSLAITPP
jgi:hypothetical protein